MPLHRLVLHLRQEDGEMNTPEKDAIRVALARAMSRDLMRLDFHDALSISFHLDRLTSQQFLIEETKQPHPLR